MPVAEPRPTIKTHRAASSRQTEPSGAQYVETANSRPGFNRSTTFEGPTQLRRDVSPVAAARISRIPSDSLTIRTQRSQLRTVDSAATDHNVFNDQDDSTFYSNSSPDRSYGERSVSPATSQGSGANMTTNGGTVIAGKKAPPPPPPSRAKKPPPPPPAKSRLIS